MLKKRIIPCLDVKDGRVVKGVNFVDLVDAGDPVEQATLYDQQGADELCFLDIGATHENRDVMYDVVSQVAEKCFIPMTVGGGVRSVNDVKNLLRAGADKVSINSAAITDRVRYDDRLEPTLAPGRSTAEAVEHGVLVSLCGAVRVALETAEQAEPVDAVLLCGGGATEIRTFLGRSAILAPDLVFEGLYQQARLIDVL